MDSKTLMRPNINMRLFWEYDVEKIDWHGHSRLVIKRVLERGTKPEWKELITFYGNDIVIETVQHKISFLPDEIIDDVSRFFKIPKEQLKCFLRKQAVPADWI